MIADSSLAEARSNKLHEFCRRCAAPVPDAKDDIAVRRFISRLTADGLWFHDCSSDEALRRILGIAS